MVAKQTDRNMPEKSTKSTPNGACSAVFKIASTNKGQEFDKLISQIHSANAPSSSSSSISSHSFEGFIRPLTDSSNTTVKDSQPQQTAPPMDYRNAISGVPHAKVTELIRLKIIPPLQKNDLLTRGSFEGAIQACIIISILHILTPFSILTPLQL